MFDFLDFHAHGPTGRPGAAAIVSVFYDEKRHGFAARNAVSELQKLSWRSVGLHPWHLPDDMEAAMRWLRFEAAQNDCLAIGEAGLDKLRGPDFQSQGEAFMACAKLAEEAEKPLIVHCVKAFDEVLAFRKALKPRQLWVLHGFQNHPNLMKTALKEGFFVSFGAAVLKNKNAQASLAACPEDRFFLETDDRPDLYIEDIYAQAAGLRGEDLSGLQWQQRANFEALFSTFAA